MPAPLNFYSRDIYPAAGVGPYAVHFPYLLQSHVEVRIIPPTGGEGVLLDEGVDYTWQSNSEITLTAAPTGWVSFIRNSDSMALLERLTAPSTLTQYQINVVNTQLLYLAQEVADSKTDLAARSITSPIPQGGLVSPVTEGYVFGPALGGGIQAIPISVLQGPPGADTGAIVPSLFIPTTHLNTSALAGVTIFRSSGWKTVGDGGELSYRRVSSVEATQPGEVTSADGIRLAPFERVVDGLAFGMFPGDNNAGADGLERAVSYCLATGATLHLTCPRDGNPYLFNRMVTITVPANKVLHVVGYGRPTLKLADGVISNTAASFKNHTAAIRLLGAGKMVVSGVVFDGNAAGQVYPTPLPVNPDTGYTSAPLITDPNIIVDGVSVSPLAYFNFGRGSSPRRHNAFMEVFGSDADGRPSLTMRQCTLSNGYFNCVATIGANEVDIQDCQGATNTLNAVAASRVSRLIVKNNRSYRDGVSLTQYPQTFFSGDRTFLQVREWPNTLTSVTETMPTLADGTTGITDFAEVVDIEGDQNAVEVVFLRGISHLVWDKIAGRNIGYGRPAGGNFNPAVVWVELCPQVEGGDAFLRQDSPRPGDMQPRIVKQDGFQGNNPDVISPFGQFQGRYISYFRRASGYCGQDWSSGGSDDNNANKKNNIFQGASIGSNVRFDLVEVEGITDCGVEAINSVYANNNRLNSIEMGHVKVRNHTGPSVVNLREYAPIALQGAVHDIHIGILEVDDLRCSTPGADAKQLINTSGNWGATTSSAGVPIINLTVDKIIADAANSADNTLNYNTVLRFRGSSASKGVQLGGRGRSVVKNFGNCWRSEAFGDYSLVNIYADTCGRLAYMDVSDATKLYGTGGHVHIEGCDGSYTVEGFNFNKGSTTNTFARLSTSANRWSGSAGASFAGLTLGTAPAKYNAFTDLDEMPVRFDPRRLFTSAPSANAMFVGEIAYKTSGGNAYYLAVNVGGGSSDWRTLP